MTTADGPLPAATIALARAIALPRWTSGVRPWPAPPVQRSRQAACPPTASRTESPGTVPVSAGSDTGPVGAAGAPRSSRRTDATPVTGSGSRGSVVAPEMPPIAKPVPLASSTNARVFGVVCGRSRPPDSW
jgi:hypothetical protein